MKNFSIGIDVSKEKFDLTVKKVHFGAEQSEFLHYDVYENNLEQINRNGYFVWKLQVLMNCTYVIICMPRGTMCGAKVHYK